jgi:holo-[acyl-carrier protein] synthase
MMVKAGIDIVKVERIAHLCKDPENVMRTFDGSETKGASYETLAGIFALKEAFFKATQAKIARWNEVIVRKDVSGKPYIVFDETQVPFQIRSIDCSISHDGEYAVAIVVIEEQ